MVDKNHEKKRDNCQACVDLVELSSFEDGVKQCKSCGHYFHEDDGSCVNMYCTGIISLDDDSHHKWITEDGDTFCKDCLLSKKDYDLRK